MSEHKTLSQSEQDQLDAATFRHFIKHLDSNKDVQNIDLMVVADFCRNCLSKWYKAAADQSGLQISMDDAKERIYGMSYDEWKRQHQKDATPEQMAVFNARRGSGAQ